ncbi:MAG: hypothetical protein IPK75_18935 [Acidobacteria bacterium]|nr:hypothetical protein [Acidobacteriota bacterium]
MPPLQFITGNPALEGYFPVAREMDRSALFSAQILQQENQNAAEKNADTALRAAITNAGAPPQMPSAPAAQPSQGGAMPSPAPLAAPSQAPNAPAAAPSQGVLSSVGRRQPDYVGELAKAPGGGRLAAAMQQQQSAQADRYAELAIRALGTGDIAGYELYSQKAGFALPPEIVDNAEQAQAFARGTDLADKIYGNDHEQAYKFIQSFMGAAGSPQQRFVSALGATGAPREKPNWTTQQVMSAGNEVLAFYDANSRGTPQMHVTDIQKYRPSTSTWTQAPTADANGNPTVGSFNSQTGQVQQGTVPRFVPPRAGGVQNDWQEVETADEQGRPMVGLLNRRTGEFRPGVAAGYVEPPRAPAPSFKPIQTLDEQGRPMVGSFDQRSGQVVPGQVPAFVPPPRGSAAGAGPNGGGRQSVFEQKRAAWLAVHPGDEQGALDYSAGRKTMSPADEMKAATQIATNEARSLLRPPSGNYVKDRADEIVRGWRGGGAAPAAPAMQRPAGGPPSGEPPSITDQSQYDALPPGTIYFDPEANDYFRKP